MALGFVAGFTGAYVNRKIGQPLIENQFTFDLVGTCRIPTAGAVT